MKRAHRRKQGAECNLMHEEEVEEHIRNWGEVTREINLKKSEMSDHIQSLKGNIWQRRKKIAQAT